MRKTEPLPTPALLAPCWREPRCGTSSSLWRGHMGVPAPRPEARQSGERRSWSLGKLLSFSVPQFLHV